MGRRKKKKNLKSEVWSKSNGLCAKCGKAIQDDKQTIDHFIPKYHGGTDDFRNLIPLCKACNRAKGSRLISVLRSMVFELLAVLILPLIWGINGIWCAVAVAEIAAFFVSWILLLSQNKNYQYL
jgi:hypothetical protein